MARYRSKDETDKAWNRIRRRITRELDIEIANQREEALDKLLTKAWEDFTEATNQGTVPELESKYAGLAEAIVKDILPPALTAATPRHDAPVE